MQIVGKVGTFSIAELSLLRMSNDLTVLEGQDNAVRIFPIATVVQNRLEITSICMDFRTATYDGQFEQSDVFLTPAAPWGANADMLLTEVYGHWTKTRSKPEPVPTKLPSRSHVDFENDALSTDTIDGWVRAIATWLATASPMARLTCSGSYGFQAANDDTITVAPKNGLVSKYPNDLWEKLDIPVGLFLESHPYRLRHIMAQFPDLSSAIGRSKTPRAQQVQSSADGILSAPKKTLPSMSRIAEMLRDTPLELAQIIRSEPLFLRSAHICFFILSGADPHLALKLAGQVYTHKQKADLTRALGIVGETNEIATLFARDAFVEGFNSPDPILDQDIGIQAMRRLSERLATSDYAQEILGFLQSQLKDINDISRLKRLHHVLPIFLSTILANRPKTAKATISHLRRSRC